MQVLAAVPRILGEVFFKVLKSLRAEPVGELEMGV